MIQSGRLNSIAELVKIKETRNAYGEQIPEVIDIIKFRCNIYNLSNQRTNENSETFYKDTKQLTTRLYLPVNDNDLIRIDNKDYFILNIIDDKTFNSKTINIEEVNT